MKRLFWVVLLSVYVGLVLLTRPGSMQGEGALTPTNGGVLAYGLRTEVVGRIEGTWRVLGTNGNYAYAMLGDALVVLDISDPAETFMVGYLHFTTASTISAPFTYAVTGNMLYLVTVKGLHVISAANPFAPVEVDFYPEATYNTKTISVVEPYIYLLKPVYSNPACLTVLRQSTAGFLVEVNPCQQVSFDDVFANAMTATEDYLFVAKDKLHVFDRTNPAEPVEIGVPLSLGYEVKEATAIGNYLYLLSSSHTNEQVSGLHIIDVSNPGQPAEVSFIHVGLEVLDMAIQGNEVYIIDHRRGLFIVDVSNPAAPIQTDWFLSARYGEELAVAGEWALFGLPFGLSQGLIALHTVEPVVQVKPLAMGPFFSHPEVVVAGDYAFVAERMDDIEVVNVADPEFPIPSYQYDLGEDYEDINYMAVAGHYLFVCEEDVHILDVSDPAAPFEVGHYGTSSNSEPLDIVVVGDYAYTVAGQAGLHIHNIANPGTPVGVGYFDTPGIAWAVDAMGQYVYVADGPEGLRIIDVSNPAAPVEVGFWDTPDQTGDVVVSADGMAYIADGDRVRIIDVSNPAVPIEMGSYESSARRLVLSGDFLYTGRQIINVVNPAQPTLAGDSFYYGNVFATDEYFYSVNDDGLIMMRFYPPTITTIPVGGGVLTSEQDGTSYMFAAGSFTDTVTVVHGPDAPIEGLAMEGLVPTQHTFEVSAFYPATYGTAELAPGQTYTITIEYTDAERAGVIEESLALYYWDGSQWVREKSSVVNTAADRIVATPNHFSTWAVLGETRLFYLPAIRR